MKVIVGAWRYRDDLWERVEGEIELDVKGDDKLVDFAVLLHDENVGKLLGIKELE